ncbi:MAG: HAD hydrolase-like protein [PVC group bacterium]|nr:HAD hydrolase-like protein [PVC group bacterium]
MKTVSDSKKSIKIIAFVLIQTILFSNGAFCLESISSQRESNDLLSPSVHISIESIKSSFQGMDTSPHIIFNKKQMQELKDYLKTIPLAAESSIKLVIFDWGNVIHNFTYEIPAQRLAEDFKVEPQKAFNFFKKRNEDPNNPVYRYENGMINQNELLFEMRRWLKSNSYVNENNLTHKKLEDLLNSIWIQQIPETVALIQELYKKGYKVRVLSTTNDIHYRFFRDVLNRPGKDQILVDPDKNFYGSHMMEDPKPHPKSYLQVIKEAGEVSESAVFIDDRVDSCNGAIKAGVGAAVLFDPIYALESIRTTMQILLEAASENKLRKLQARDMINPQESKASIQQEITRMVTPLPEQDKHTSLLNESIKRYHNITIDQKALDRFKDIWQVDTLDIGTMWKLMLELTNLPLLSKIEKIVGGEKHHQLLHVKGTVDSLAEINKYRKGTATEDDVIEFLKPGYKNNHISPGCIQPMLERYNQIDSKKLKVLALAVILHDYGKLIAWSNEGIAGEAIVYHFLDKFREAGVITAEEMYLTLCITVLHLDLGILHFMESVPTDILPYLEKQKTKLKILNPEFDGKSFERDYFQLASILYFVDFSNIGMPVATDNHIRDADFLGVRENVEKLLNPELFGPARLWLGILGAGREVVVLEDMDKQYERNFIAETELQKFTLEEKDYLYNTFLKYAGLRGLLIYIFRQMKETNPENVIKFVYLLMKLYEKCGAEEVIKIVDSFPVNFVEDAEFMNNCINSNSDKLNIPALRELFETRLTEEKMIKVINSLGIPIVRNGKKITINFKSRQQHSQVDLLGGGELQQSSFSNVTILEHSI